VARHTASSKTGPIEQYVREGFRKGLEAGDMLSLEGAAGRLLLATKRAAFALTDEGKSWVEASEMDRLMAITVIFDHFHIKAQELVTADQGLLDTVNRIIKHDPENLFSNIQRSLVREFARWIDARLVA